MTAPAVFPWLPVLIALLAGGGLGALLGAIKARSTQQITDLFERQLADAQRTLGERDTRLAAQAQELRVLRGEIEAAQRRSATADMNVAAARQRSLEVEPLTQQLHDRDSELMRLNADLDALHDHYASEVGELRRKLGDNDALRTQLARADQQLRALDARLAIVQRDKDFAIASLNTRLAELESLALAEPAEIALPEPATAEIAPMPEPLSALPRDLRVRELEHDLARLRQRIIHLDELHDVIQQRDREIERLRNQQEEFRK